MANEIILCKYVCNHFGGVHGFVLPPATGVKHIMLVPYIILEIRMQIYMEINTHADVVARRKSNVYQIHKYVGAYVYLIKFTRIYQLE